MDLERTKERTSEEGMAKPGRLVELSVRMPSIVDVEGMVEIVSHPIAKPFHHVFESLHTVALWKEMFILDNVFDFDIPNKLEGDRQKGEPCRRTLRGVRPKKTYLKAYSVQPSFTAEHTSGYVSQNHAVYTISSDVQGIGFGIDLDVSFQIEVVGRTETSSSVVVAVKPNVKRVPFWGLSRLVHQAIVDETAAVFVRAVNLVPNGNLGPYC
ncbi:unnamed protein product (mitochondrion) [Plasmodiophora brassicae]|uniref:VASt domain-containing protein n=1 Tax=Plasmodiophora brassicae TaxID=37360 RepID=A0A3P3Y037_PLABS|nr:unnamed protein product [Plasmodiophora brassicae]